MTLSSSFNLPRSVLAIAALALQPFLLGQGSSILTVAPPAKIAAKKSAAVESKISVHLRNGYHVNSNAPAEDYLIPLRLTWENSGPLETAGIVYPKPQMEKYDFSSKPISVFTGDFQILTKFKVAPNAPAGPGGITGKLRYQACSQNTCFPPQTVQVRLPYEIQ